MSVTVAVPTVAQLAELPAEVVQLENESRVAAAVTTVLVMVGLLHALAAALLLVSDGEETYHQYVPASDGANEPLDW